CQQGNDDPLTF
nr:immunoglobulin light chain junction region [Macaca mulatta]MOX91235.1 immunoglobulin light chain junction region [Macaca mulatta]